MGKIRSWNHGWTCAVSDALVRLICTASVDSLLVVFHSVCDFQDNCCVDQSSTATMCEKLHLLRGTCVVRTSALFDRCFVTGPEGIDINAALPLTISMAISAVLQYATHMVRYGRCCTYDAATAVLPGQGPFLLANTSAAAWWSSSSPSTDEHGWMRRFCGCVS
eukprot:COSAG01_NODE_3795_length_5688_cov_11.154410_4_plen_164_part_00